MRFIFKLIAILLTLVIVIGIAAIVIFKTQVPSLTSFFVDKKTGYPTKMESFESTLTKGLIDTRHISISNPPSFPYPTFIDINQVKVDLDLESLDKETLVIEEAVVDINKFSYITDKAKNNNLKQFITAFQSPKEAESSEESKEPTQAKKPFKFLIQRLAIRLNTVEIADFSKAANGSLKTYNVAINLELTNVSDVKDIIKQLQKKLLSLDISFLTNILMDSLSSLDYSSSIGTLVDGNLDELSEKLKGEGKKIIDKSIKGNKENIDKAIDEGLEKTNEIIKDIFNPLKKKEE